MYIIYIYIYIYIFIYIYIIYIYIYIYIKERATRTKTKIAHILSHWPKRKTLILPLLVIINNFLFRISKGGGDTTLHLNWIGSVWWMCFCVFLKVFLKVFLIVFLTVFRNVFLKVFLEVFPKVFVHVFLNVFLAQIHRAKHIDRKNPPPQGGFLFTMFLDQEPGGRGPPRTICTSLCLYI